MNSPATAALLLFTLPALAGPETEFIRVAPDHWTFDTSVSKTPFIPFGANFVLSDKRYLNTFDPGAYGPARFEHVLAALEGLGFNIVKVFLPIGERLPDPQVPGSARIAPGYLDNLDDFLRLAARHHIRVVVCLACRGGWWSLFQRCRAVPIWRRLLMQLARLAAVFAREKAGKSKAARLPITAITTRSSRSVNAEPPQTLLLGPKLLTGSRFRCMALVRRRTGWADAKTDEAFHDWGVGLMSTNCGWIPRRIE